MKLVKVKCKDSKVLASGKYHSYGYCIIPDEQGGYTYVVFNGSKQVLKKESGFNSISKAIKSAIDFIDSGSVE